MLPSPGEKPARGSGAKRERVGRRRGRARIARERAGIALLALTLTLPALLLGGQHTWVLLLAAVLAASSSLLLSHRVERLPKAAWLVLALVAYTALQLVPLPFALVKWLSPGAGEVWSSVLRPFGEAAPSFVTLSVDPGATAIELLKGSIYACIAVAVPGVVLARGTSVLPTILFGASLLVACVTLAHGLFDIERVYGLYVSPSSDRWTRGPFVNGNNLSGFLNVGLFAGAGLWLSEQQRVPRWLPALGIPVLAASVVLSGSRGGVGALLAGALAFVVFALARLGRRKFPLIGGAVLIGSAAAVALFAGGGDRVKSQLADSNVFAKTLIWRWSWPLIRDFPIFGVGRGGFETAFPPYRGPSEHELSSVCAHAENFLIDWSAEWGIPATLGAVAASVWLARSVWSRVQREPRMLGLWVGFAVLLLQNLVDLGLEVFALAALAVAVYATREPEQVSGGERPWLRSVPAACAVVSALVVLALGTHAVQLERRRLAQAVSELGPGRGEALVEARKSLRSAMLRHPGEAYFPLLGSILARLERKDALPWLARALERAPRLSSVHLALADALRARGSAAQALLHLRFAARYDANLRDLALMRAARWAKSVPELAHAFPEGSEGGSLFKEACRFVAESARIDCFREALRREPADAGLRKELAEPLLDAWEANAAPCSGAAATGCSEELSRLLVKLPSGEWRATQMRGRLQALRGDVPGAARALLEDCPASAEAEPCVVRALEFAERSADLELVGRAGERYVALRCTNPPRCADAHVHVGKIFARRGAWAPALKQFNAGVEADPSPRRWLEVADAASHIGSVTTARLALRRAVSMGELTRDDAQRRDEIERNLDDPERLE